MIFEIRRRLVCHPALTLAFIFLLIQWLFIALASLEFLSQERGQWFVKILFLFDLPASIVGSLLLGRGNSIDEIIVVGLLGSFQWFLVGLGVGKLGVRALKKGQHKKYPILLRGGLFLLHSLALAITHSIDHQHPAKHIFDVGWTIFIDACDTPIYYIVDAFGGDSGYGSLFFFGGLQWFVIGFLLGWLGIVSVEKLMKQNQGKKSFQ